jgi:hypothetical protein
MNWDEFEIGFWHPFGSHGYKPDGTPESAEEILIRKYLFSASNSVRARLPDR